MTIGAATVAAITGSLAACSPLDVGVYTLYRNSLVPGVSRMHVATFDTSEGVDYNRENCDLAADLFNAQDGIKTKFWCEAGRFRAQ